MTDRVPGTKPDYYMVVKGSPEQDKVEKNYSHNHDSGLDAETWVFKQHSDMISNAA